METKYSIVLNANISFALLLLDKNQINYYNFTVITIKLWL